MPPIYNGVTSGLDRIGALMCILFRCGLVLCFLQQLECVLACTAFTVSRAGHTFIGCNEDAWSINAQVRFVQGRNGDHGAIYFDHFNGHPLRKQGPQLGMNEAGLVFDGLTIQPQNAAPVPGRKQVHFDDLMPRLMRTCTTVQEVAALLRTYDFSWLTRSMLFFADRDGDYLVVENDTMILGHDPAYAVGNWRMGTCGDPAAIPIPRLQAGRDLLLSGNGASFDQAEEVLSTMTVCRAKMGEGTLFSVLFDPQEAQAHLYFYHDFSQRVSFDLKKELAKGDRTVDMASLFSARPEYERLKNHLTPFHQRWLFWGLFALAALAGICGLWAFITLVRQVVARLRTKRRMELAIPLLTGFASALLVALTGILLLNEGVYYFGLGDATDAIHPALKYAPLLSLVATSLLLSMLIRRTMINGVEGIPWPHRITLLTQLTFLTGLFYWDLVVL